MRWLLILLAATSLQACTYHSVYVEPERGGDYYTSSPSTTTRSNYRYDGFAELDSYYSYGSVIHSDDWLGVPYRVDYHYGDPYWYSSALAIGWHRYPSYYRSRWSWQLSLGYGSHYGWSAPYWHGYAYRWPHYRRGYHDYYYGDRYRARRELNRFEARGHVSRRALRSTARSNTSYRRTSGVQHLQQDPLDQRAYQRSNNSAQQRVVRELRRSQNHSVSAPSAGSSQRIYRSRDVRASRARSEDRYEVLSTRAQMRNNSASRYRDERATDRHYENQRSTRQILSTRGADRTQTTDSRNARQSLQALRPTPSRQEPQRQASPRANLRTRVNTSERHSEPSHSPRAKPSSSRARDALREMRGRQPD